MDDEGPKWRLEHASNNRSVCQKASCKRAQVKIATGELRIGTHTLFTNDVEQRWYMAWRHWGCATKFQIQGLKDTTGNDPTKAPGYDQLSPESQEQVKLAFEEGTPVDKEFKGIREDLAKAAPRYAQEYRDAEGYKVDIGKRAAACRGADCLSKNAKVLKGELRFGISVAYDGDHASMMYKHWKCMSAYDLEQAKGRFDEDQFDGLDSIPAEYMQVVVETFKTGQIVEPPEPEAPTPKPKKARAKKIKVADDEDDGETEVPKPKRTRKKRTVEEADISEDEYVPKKTKSRQARVEEMDPAVAKIEALTEQMRNKTAN